MTKFSCAFVDMPIWSDYLKREYTECEDWRENVVDRLVDLKPDLVVIASARWFPVVDDADEDPGRQGAGMARLIKRIPGTVAILMDTPRSAYDVPACLAHRDAIEACATSRAAASAGGTGAARRRPRLSGASPSTFRRPGRPARPSSARPWSTATINTDGQLRGHSSMTSRPPCPTSTGVVTRTGPGRTSRRIVGPVSCACWSPHVRRLDHRRDDPRWPHARRPSSTGAPRLAVIVRADIDRDAVDRDRIARPRDRIARAVDHGRAGPSSRTRRG
jgi:hypothetical protein